MNKSLILSLIMAGLLLGSELSVAGGPIDFPGPGYRRQLEMIDHPKRDYLFGLQRPTAELKTSSGFDRQTSPIDFSQPIRLFAPQSTPPVASPVPSSSPAQK